jgi:Tfp pilus assembly protein PilN
VLGIGVEEGAVRALLLARGQIAWAASAHYATPEELRQVLAQLAAQRPRGVREARVALSGGLAQSKLVEGLPRLSSRDLASHVALRPRCYFPMNGVPLVTDAVRLSRWRQKDQVAFLAAASEGLVEAIAAGLTEAGLRTTDIAPVSGYADTALQRFSRALAGLAGDGASFFAAYAAASGESIVSLMPPSLRRETRRVRGRGARRWAAAGAVSLLLAAASYATGLVRQRAAAERELAALASSAQRAASVRRDLDRTHDALGILRRAEEGRLKVAALLGRLTSALPDSAFVTMLRLDAGGQGVLVGYAPQAARALAALEQVAGITAPELEGAVTREVVAGRERERFAIRFTLVQGSER